MRSCQSRVQVLVVKHLHRLGQPTRHVDAVGDVADGNLFFHSPGPEVRPHPPRHVTVQRAHRIGPPRKLQADHRHAEQFVLVLRFDAAEAHQLLVRDAQLLTQRAQVLFDQLAFEAVVTRGHRRVRGEHRVLRHVAQRIVERQAVVAHPFADDFQRRERSCDLRSSDTRRGRCSGPAAPSRRRRRAPVPDECGCARRRRKVGWSARDPRGDCLRRRSRAGTTARGPRASATPWRAVCHRECRSKP